jgi:hypothetical protein
MLLNLFSYTRYRIDKLPKYLETYRIGRIFAHIETKIGRSNNGRIGSVYIAYRIELSTESVAYNVVDEFENVFKKCRRIVECRVFKCQINMQRRPCRFIESI